DVISLAADFEQHCDGLEAALWGELRVNSAVPLTFEKTPGSSVPEPFAFTAVDYAAPSALLVSDSTTVYGINSPSAISIAGGEYSVNGGPFTSVAGTAGNRDRVRVRRMSSSTPGATASATLSVGGVTVSFDVTTYAAGTELTGIYFRSLPGHYVGQGQTRLNIAPHAEVEALAYDSTIELHIDVPLGKDFFAIFGAPEGSALSEGVYESAGPVPDANLPRLVFGGDGRGCNETIGRFIVRELTFNPDGTPERVAVDFEHRCDRASQPLFGEIRFHSTVPFSALLAQVPPVVVPITNDFDGDGLGDIAWSHADGRVALWLMDGALPGASAEILGAGSGWQVAQATDFDGDGRSDIAWQHPDGRVAIYLMNGTTIAEARQLLNSGGGWSIAKAGDLDGDGMADLVFANADGTVAAWIMNGTVPLSTATLLGAGSGWLVTNIKDFDGDGKADLLWRHADGSVAVWLMDGTSLKRSYSLLGGGTGWSVSHTADLDGDGRADLVWQHADGRVAVWVMSVSTVAKGVEILEAGTGWSVTHVADFDGDGKDDLLFTHADGRVAIYLMDSVEPRETTQILNAGSGWSVKRTADLDGDGKSDIVWQHSDGRVAVWIMNGTAMASGGEILGAGTGWSVSGAP
ncbi:MAG: VCBS repeat-containing protein, partial [Betaproteobacteria bacterium]